MRQLGALCGFILLTLAVLAAARPKAGQSAATVRKNVQDKRKTVFIAFLPKHFWDPTGLRTQEQKQIFVKKKKREQLCILCILIITLRNKI